MIVTCRPMLFYYEHVTLVIQKRKAFWFQFKKNKKEHISMYRRVPQQTFYEVHAEMAGGPDQLELRSRQPRWQTSQGHRGLGDHLSTNSASQLGKLSPKERRGTSQVQKVQNGEASIGSNRAASHGKQRWSLGPGTPSKSWLCLLPGDGASEG